MKIQIEIPDSTLRRAVDYCKSQVESDVVATMLDQFGKECVDEGTVEFEIPQTEEKEKMEFLLATMLVSSKFEKRRNPKK